MNFSFSIKRLPFIGNYPLRDVYWMLLLLPLWWVLGVEQFIYPIILTVSTLKIIARRDIKIDRIVLLYTLFLIVYCISVFYIPNTERLLTFMRNFGAYYSAALLLFIFSNERLDYRYVEKIITSIIFVMVIASVIGLLGVLGAYRSSFTSFIGNFLPAFITNTTYGGLIANRSIGLYQWFILFGEYYRITSLFLFSTFFASTLAITFPLFWYKFKTRKSNKGRIVFVLLMILLVINLVFTTARIATASLITGLLFIYFFHPETKYRYKRIFFWGTLSLTFLFFAIVFFGKELQMILDAVLYARGGGSASSRLAVYKATLSGFLERPIFGWGTEQDVKGLLYPAGSHSNYLGILYKQGAIGFLLMAGVYMLTWIKISKNSSIHPTLNRTIKGIFIIILLNGMTDVLDLDATTFVIAWTILGTGIYGKAHRKKVILKKDG